MKIFCDNNMCSGNTIEIHDDQNEIDVDLPDGSVLTIERKVCINKAQNKTVYLCSSCVNAYQILAHGKNDQPMISYPTTPVKSVIEGPSHGEIGSDFKEALDRAFPGEYKH